MVSVLYHPASTTFGLYDLACENLCKGIHHEDAFTSWVTLKNIFSWFPLVGAIIGGLRLYEGINTYKEVKTRDEKSLAIGLIARSIVEIVTLGCAGPLLFIVDMIFVIGRCCLKPLETKYVPYIPKSNQVKTQV